MNGVALLDQRDEGAARSSADRSAPPVWQMVVALAWPVLMQQWLVVAVHLSDRLLAGRFLDLDGPAHAATLAAQTTGAYLHWFLSSYSVLVNVGATALMAHLVGAGDRRGAQVVLHQALLLAFALGLLGTVLGLLFLAPALAALQLHGAAAVYAAEYLRPLLLLLVFHMVGQGGIACLAGAGDTRTGLWVLGGVTIFNLPLAWLFFHGLGPIPALGFPGIAVGTAVSQTLGGLVVVGVLIRGRAHLRLRLSQLWPDLALLRRLLRISIPAAVDSMSMQLGYFWFLGIINGLGDVAGAAHGIALAWESLGYQSGAAFGTAALTVVGQSLGAGRPDRAVRGGWFAFALGAGMMSLMGLLFLVFATPMFHLFCPKPSQAPIIAAGVPVLRLVAFAMPGLASCIVLAWALRGAGDTRFPMLFTWLGFFVLRIPLAYLLTRDSLDLGPLGVVPGWNLGLYGAWLAMFADIQVRGLFVLWRFLGGRWRTIRV